MKKLRDTLLYWLLNAFVWSLAILPMWILYRLSDLSFLLLYHVVRYRRRVVWRNIRGSFPDRTDRECRQIARRFYRHFADYIFETIKLRHVSDCWMRRHFVFDGIDMSDRLLDEGKSVIVYFSHCGNWEWATSVTLWSDRFSRIIPGQVYRPLKSKPMDRLMLRLRSRFHSVGYPKATVFRDLLRDKMEGRQSYTGFMSDQKPSHGDRVHILRFLNRPTAVITGTELAARRLGAAALYWDMEKTRRGHYRVTMRLIADDVSKTPEYAVTDAYIRMLEQTIDRQPHIWLWSHNRWKKPVEMPAQ